MKKAIILIFGFLMLVGIVYAANNLYFSLTLHFSAGKLSKGNINLIQSEETLDFKKEQGDYKINIVSFDGSILYQSYFDIETRVVPEPLKEWFDEEGKQIVVPDEPLETELKEKSIALFIPYFKNVNSINIYDNRNELKLSLDVSKFATCNMNNICDLKESRELCPEDCPFPEGKLKLSLWQRIINFVKSLFK